MMATPTEFRAYLVCTAIKAKYNIHIVYFLFQFGASTTYDTDADAVSEIGPRAIKNDQI